MAHRDTVTVEVAKVRVALRSGKARELRESLLLSQGDIARECGVTATAVSRWESGKTSPRAASARKLSRLYAELAAAVN